MVTTIKIKSSANQGFTLIEMMIAILVIGILVAIAYPNYQKYTINSKRADMMAEMQQMANRIEAQKIGYKKYENIPLDKVYGRPAVGGAVTFPYDAPAMYDVTVWNIAATPSSKVTGSTMPGVKWEIQAIPKSTTMMGGDGKLTLNYKGRKCRNSNCGTEDQWRK